LLKNPIPNFPLPTERTKVLEETFYILAQDHNRPLDLNTKDIIIVVVVVVVVIIIIIIIIIIINATLC
jgi:hypothetical protein